MILGIDASNIRAGGGITHLVEMLRAANPSAHGFSKVVTWGGRDTLEKLEHRPWLSKVYVPRLDGGLPARAFWQRYELSKAARKANCSLLLIPGGAYTGDFEPVVVMSRNLLPFEWREMWRYKLSQTLLRCLILRFVQGRSFKRAALTIFLTEYARQTVMRAVRRARGESTIVPHGVEQAFFAPPKPQQPITDYSAAKPYRIVYVSIIDVYKHQWQVVEALAQLRAEGFPVSLELVGPYYRPSLRRLMRAIKLFDPACAWVSYRGRVPHSDLAAIYGSADMIVFASSCENMPNILLESMAAGVPIACSSRGPMPEVLGDGGVYFDPESPQTIAAAIRALLLSPEERGHFAQRALARAKTFSWARCSTETFTVLRSIAARDGYFETEQRPVSTGHRTR